MLVGVSEKNIKNTRRYSLRTDVLLHYGDAARLGEQAPHTGFIAIMQVTLSPRISSSKNTAFGSKTAMRSTIGPQDRRSVILPSSIVFELATASGADNVSGLGFWF